MTTLAFYAVALSITGCLGALLLPRRVQVEAVSACGAAFLLVASPTTALWIVATSALCLVATRSTFVPNRAVVLGGLLLFVAMLALRDYSTLDVVGISYATLRQIHVLVDCRLGRLRPPGFGALLRYHFFLPALLAGPIHRFQGFAHECGRRRIAAPEVFTGLERILFGIAKVVIVGDYLVGERLVEAVRLGAAEGFGPGLVASLLAWARLYAQFSGFTDVALGTARILGIRLPENFERPFLARDLLDFWSRWHITLSDWCRDYAYAPVAAATRMRFAGVFVAMLAMGLWHEASGYYVLWAGYHAVGITMMRVARTTWPGAFETRAARLLLPVFVLFWLCAARPLLSGVFQVAAP